MTKLTVKDSITAGGYDSDFGMDKNGIVTTPANGKFYGSSKQHGSGRILSVGSSNEPNTLVIMAHDKNGISDPTFGKDGIAFTQVLPQGETFSFRNFIFLPDGKMVIYGTDKKTKIFFTQLNSDASLDNNFGNSGTTTFDLPAPYTSYTADAYCGMETLKDGRILATVRAGETPDKLSVSFILCVEGNGSPSKIFAESGMYQGWAGMFVSSIAIQESNGEEKILACGSYNRGGLVARLTTHGKLDTTYDNFGQGYVILDAPGSFAVSLHGITQDGSNSVVIGVFSPFDNPLDRTPITTRLDSRGAIDPTFNRGSFVRHEELEANIGRSVRLQSDKKIIVLAQSVPPGNSTLVRIHPNGQKDTDYGVDGKTVIHNIHSSPNASLELLDEKILVTGSSLDTTNSVMVRILTE